MTRNRHYLTIEALKQIVKRMPKTRPERIAAVRRRMMADALLTDRSAKGAAEGYLRERSGES